MSFEPAAQILDGARRSADAVVQRESASWNDAQYERFLSRHYREMAAESLRFLETLRQCNREAATLLRSLESSR